MKVLVFDTETTDLPKGKDPDAENQPWPVQLGAVLMDLRDDKPIRTMNVLVNPPERVHFEPRAVAVHGLTEELVRAEGTPIMDVLLELRDLRRQADIVAAYNLAFDEFIIRSSSRRLHPDFIDDPVLGTPEDIFHHCIMQQSIAYFKMRMKLGMVYQRLMKVPLTDAHDALADALAAAEIMKELTALQMSN